MLRLKLFILTVLAAASLAAAAQPATAGTVQGLDLGLVDGFAYGDTNASARALAFDRTVSARANLVLIGVRWSQVAPSTPTKPPGFDATDPFDPAYNWTRIDAAVRDATARGLRVVLHVVAAPKWAEGPNRPSESVAPEGGWNPNPSDIEDFAHAIATRYSGDFPTLPRVRTWQLWAEPNLQINLSPQTVGGNLVSGNQYRLMQNAFYDGLKAVNPANFVVTAGTAPYGNLFPGTGPVWPRSMPILFWRQFFCLQGDNLTPVSCPDPPRFDAIAHHPINAFEPTRPATNPLDVATPDLYKIKNVLNKAIQVGHVQPAGSKPFWATEIWWNSKPPVSGGAPLAKHARFLAQSLYVLWKQNVSTAVWFEIRDYQTLGGLPIPRCGLFFRDGRPKPAYFAYRFPFVAQKLPSGKRRKAGRRPPARRFELWGKAPKPGRVLIQAKRKGGKKWRTVKRLTAGSNRIFVGTVLFRGPGKMRAKSGSEASLGYRL